MRLASCVVLSSVSPKLTPLQLVQIRCASKNLNLDWHRSRHGTVWCEESENFHLRQSIERSGSVRVDRRPDPGSPRHIREENGGPQLLRRNLTSELPFLQYSGVVVHHTWISQHRDHLSTESQRDPVSRGWCSQHLENCSPSSYTGLGTLKPGNNLGRCIVRPWTRTAT